jgi:ketosteroid isomerase-like protein
VSAVSASEAPRNRNPDDAVEQFGGELRLDPLVHGTSRVPGQQRPAFDLAAFVASLEHHDVDDQLACYAPDAEIRVVDPDSPSLEARTMGGGAAIRSWLDSSGAPSVEVVDVVDGGDRVAFTERWQQPDGTAVVATSTAELRDGLITTQHTVLARAHESVDLVDGWTRVSNDLWTKSD